MELLKVELLKVGDVLFLKEENSLRSTDEERLF